MKLARLIGFLQDKLEEQKVLVPVPCAADPKQRNTYLMNLEAHKTFRALAAVIKKLEDEQKKYEAEEAKQGRYNASPDVSAKHVNVINEFFAKRWDRIKSTNIIYNIETKSPANVMCMDIAQYITQQLRSVVGDDKVYFSLLMPTIESWRNARSAGHDITVLHPHNFLPTDDNKHCIGLGFVKEELEGSRMVLKNTEGTTVRRLSDAEFERVTNHTAAAKRYYDSMERMLKTPVENKEPINRAKIEFRDALSKLDYAKYGLTANYKNGDALLTANLLKDEKDLFASREELFDYMSVFLTPAQWDEFLLGKDPNPVNQHPFKDIIGKDQAALTEAINSPAVYNGDEKHDRIALFCFADAYWCDRAGQGSVKSLTGRLFRAYTKDEKEEAVKLIKTFLKENKLSEWPDYVKKQQGRLAGAIEDGTVGYISAQIRAIEAKRLAKEAEKTASVSNKK